MLQKKEADPLEIVSLMRKDRPNMVETVEQYDAIVEISNILKKQWFLFFFVNKAS